MQKIIYIIGARGRTGAMFGHELRHAARVVAIDRGADFGAAIQKDWPDFIWMATRNPVAEAVKFYYRFFSGKEKVPALILSQNGLSAVNDARIALKEAIGQAPSTGSGQALSTGSGQAPSTSSGQGADKVRIIRVSLCNQVEVDNSKDLKVKYKLPVRLGFGAINGQSDDIGQIFADAGFVAQKFSGRGVADMEYSKLMSNLIGMAAAASGLSVGEGYRDKKIFCQEIEMLKEFSAIAKKQGVKFVRLGNYPMGFVALVITLPLRVIMPFRGLIAAILVKKRDNKPKDLSEIDYYNGDVVKLGKKLGIPTPVNEAVMAKASGIFKK